MATIDPNAELFDDDTPENTNAADVDTSFASVEMNGPSAPPPMGAPPPVVEDEDSGTLIITVRVFQECCLCPQHCLLILSENIAIV